MITILDCIKQIPDACDRMLRNYEENFKELTRYLEDKVIDEIIFVGSGTSNTSSVTAADYVEKLSGLRVNHYIPNELINKKYLNKDALYVFVSQSGTSTLTNKLAEKIKKENYYNVALCSDSDSKMVGICDTFVNLFCKDEAYGMRTIGYVSTVYTEILLGICVGKNTKNLSIEEERRYLADLNKVKDGIVQATIKAQEWYKMNGLTINSASTIAIYGAKGLWGVSLEGALKILEISRKVTAIGYELDDGCHGPTMGYDDNYVVIVLNVDDDNKDTAKSLARFAKGELKGGYMIGQNIIDDKDILFNPYSTYFKELEFAPFVQVLAYELALDYSVDLKPISLSEPLPEKKYFNMHEEG